MNYYGHDTPDDYGFHDNGWNDYHLYWPVHDFYVLSVHSMLQFSKNKDAGCNWFERFVPIKIINHTLYVFDLRREPNLGREPTTSLRVARSFTAKQDWGAAIPHYKHYLVHQPEDVTVHQELADAARNLGHNDMYEHHFQIVNAANDALSK